MYIAYILFIHFYANQKLILRMYINILLGYFKNINLNNNVILINYLNNLICFYVLTIQYLST